MKNWLTAHKASFLALLVYWPTLVAFWAFSPDFRGYVLHLYVLLPAWAHEFGTAVVIPAIAFWKVRKNREQQQNGSNGLRVPCLVFALLTLAPVSVHAQQLKTLYAGGVSWSPGASPAFAGTVLAATQVSPDTAPGTYGFTAIDILPSTMKPFTVSTNVALGMARKLFTVGNYTVYSPLAAGFSLTSTNAGWNWSTGGCADVPLKNGFGLMPCVRVLKSNVGNGSGYQLMPSVLLRWGK